MTATREQDRPQETDAPPVAQSLARIADSLDAIWSLLNETVNNGIWQARATEAQAGTLGNILDVLRERL